MPWASPGSSLPGTRSCRIGFAALAAGVTGSAPADLLPLGSGRRAGTLGHLRGRLGMDPRGASAQQQQPHHRRIRDFRPVPREASASLFVQTLRLCLRAGLVSPPPGRSTPPRSRPPRPTHDGFPGWLTRLDPAGSPSGWRAAHRQRSVAPESPAERGSPSPPQVSTSCQRAQTASTTAGCTTARGGGAAFPESGSRERAPSCAETHTKPALVVSPQPGPKLTTTGCSAVW